jgi:hypothetical protein
MLNLLRGKKTYIVSGLMILISILKVGVSILNGESTFIDALQSDAAVQILEGLGLGTLRAGVSKGGK